MVTKTKMCVVRYTNKIWPRMRNVFNTIKSYYINNNIMKQSNYIDIMLRGGGGGGGGGSGL